MNSLQIPKIKKIRVLSDMDDVFVDFLAGVIEELNKRTGSNYTVEDCKSWNLKEQFGEIANEIISEPGFFLKLKPKADNLKWLKKLYEHPLIDLKIVTASMPSAYHEKIEWLINHCPWLNIKTSFISTQDKGSVWGHILVDDGLHNIYEFDEIGIGEPIIYDMAHNRTEQNYRRVYSLEEVLRLIETDYLDKIDKEIAS